MKKKLILIIFLLMSANVHAGLIGTGFKAIKGLFGGGGKKTEINAYKKETNNQYDKLEKQENITEAGVVKDNKIKTDIKTTANVDIAGINKSNKQNQKAGRNLTNTTNDSNMIEKIFASQTNMILAFMGLLFSFMGTIIGYLFLMGKSKNKQLSKERAENKKLFNKIIDDNEDQIKKHSKQKQIIIMALLNYVIKTKKENKNV